MQKGSLVPRTYKLHPQTFLDMEKIEPGLGANAAARSATGEYLKNKEATRMASDLVAKFVRWAENTIELPISFTINEYRRAKINQPGDTGAAAAAAARTGFQTGFWALARASSKPLSMAARIALMGLAGYAYNKTMHEEDSRALEDAGFDLSKVIILKGSEGGNPPIIINVDTLGSGFLEWMAIGKLARTINQYNEGLVSAKDAALTHMLYAPANKIANALTLPKIVAGVLTGYDIPQDPVKVDSSTFLDTSPIPEKSRYLANVLGVQNLYDYLTDYPSRKGRQFPETNPLFYAFNQIKIDPREQAYVDTLRMVNKYNRETKGVSSIEIPDRSDKDLLLYKYHLSRRIGDLRLAEFYKEEYLKNGGTEESLDKSIKYRNPVAGIKDSDMVNYIKSLGPESRWKLNIALDFYDSVYSGKPLKDIDMSAVSANQIYSKIYPNPKELLLKPEGWKVLVQLINEKALSPKMEANVRVPLLKVIGAAIKAGYATREDLEAVKKAGFLVNIPVEIVDKTQKGMESRKSIDRTRDSYRSSTPVNPGERFNP
jgi:hypothetical protein